MNAIFIHDSKWATEGVGKWANNPGNLRCMSSASPYKHQCVESPGNGFFAKFQTLEDGIGANVDLYARLYAGKTAREITRIWAQTNNPSYFSAIDKCYR
jgi:hypothetical protein